MSTQHEREYLANLDREGVKDLLDLLEGLADDSEYKVNLPPQNYDQIYFQNQL